MKTLPIKSKQILLSKNEYTLMRDYFVKCSHDGFTESNNYTRINPVREFFYQWHLVDIIRKFSRSRGSEVVFVSLTPPEVKTVQAMFQRIDCDEKLQGIQRRFVN